MLEMKIGRGMLIKTPGRGRIFIFKLSLAELSLLRYKIV
jgi:hypothetical protein